MKFSSPFLAIFPTAWWYFWKRSGPWSSHYITDLRRGGGFIRQSVTQPYRHQTPGRAMSVLQHSHSQHRCIFWSFSDRTLILAYFGWLGWCQWLAEGRLGLRNNDDDVYDCNDDDADDAVDDDDDKICRLTDDAWAERPWPATRSLRSYRSQATTTYYCSVLNEHCTQHYTCTNK